MEQKNNNEVKNKNSKKIIYLVVISLVLLTLVGVSFARFFAKDFTDILSGNMAKISMEFLGGENKISTIGIPIYAEDVETEASYMIFSVENTGNRSMYTEIYLQNISMTSDVFKSSDVKYSLEEGSSLTESGFNTSTSKVSSGDFSNMDTSDTTNNKILIAKNVQVDKGETKYFKVRVWVQENGEDQSGFSGESVSLKIGVRGNARGPQLADSSDVLLDTLKGQNIRNLKISGNTVQTPINLFKTVQDVSTTSSGVSITATAGNDYFTLNGTATANGSGRIAPNLGVFEAGEYTVSVTGLNTINSTFDKIYVANASDNSAIVYNVMTDSPKTFTLTEDTEIRVTVVFASGTVYDNKNIYVNITKSTPSPKAPATLQSVGDYDEETNKYKIPVTVSGKNLLDFDNMQLINTTETVVSGGWEFEFTNDTNVTISYGDTESLPTYVLLAKKVTDGVYGSNIQLTSNITTISLSAHEKLLVFVETTSVTGSYSVLENNDINWIQLEKGTTATAYEPYVEPITTNIYLDEPLRAIGENKDYIDFNTGKVVRKIIDYTSSGNETWSFASNNTDTISFYMNAYNVTGYGTTGNTNRLNILSNRLLTANQTNIECVKATGNVTGKTNGLVNITLLKSRIGYEDTDTNAQAVEKLKSWLASNPVDFLWGINEYTDPIEDDIKLPEIKTIGGTNIITIGTTVQPELELN